jgi:hypothetical protein
MAAIAHPDLTHDRPLPRLRLCPSPSRASSAAVYRRRRAVVLLALLLAVVGLCAIVVQLQAPGSTEVRTTSATSVKPTAVAAPAAPAAPPVYVVQPGDTLWSIAAALHPDGDIRGTVDRLVERNGTAALQTGQRLWLP